MIRPDINSPACSPFLYPCCWQCLWPAKGWYYRSNHDPLKARYLAGAEEKLKLRLLEPRAALSDQGSGLEEFSVDVVKGKPLQLHIGRLGKRGLGAQCSLRGL